MKQSVAEAIVAAGNDIGVRISLIREFANHNGFTHAVECRSATAFAAAVAAAMKYACLESLDEELTNGLIHAGYKTYDCQDGSVIFY